MADIDKEQEASLMDEYIDTTLEENIKFKEQLAQLSSARTPDATHAASRAAAAASFKTSRMRVRRFDLTDRKQAKKYAKVLTRIIRGTYRLHKERLTTEGDAVTICWIEKDPKLVDRAKPAEHINKETGKPYLIQPKYPDPKNADHSDTPGFTPTRPGEIDDIAARIQRAQTEKAAKSIVLASKKTKERDERLLADNELYGLTGRDYTESEDE